jgi:hypothetical protein
MKHGETAFTLKAGEMAWKCHQGYGLLRCRLEMDTAETQELNFW